MVSKEKKIKVIGLFFLILGITAIINTYLNDSPAKILYLCYIGLIILGIGALRKSQTLILSQIYILAIPLLIWNADFFYELIFNKPLLGITSYFFVESFLALSKIISLQHIITIPLAIYTINLIGFKKTKAHLLSILQVSLFFVIALLFTPKEININCAYYLCASITIPYYQYLYLIIFAASIYLTKYLIENYINKNDL